MNVSEVVSPVAQLDSKNPAHIFSVPPQVAVLMASKLLSKACVVDLFQVPLECPHIGPQAAM